MPSPIPDWRATDRTQLSRATEHECVRAGTGDIPFQNLTSSSTKSRTKYFWFNKYRLPAVWASMHSAQLYTSSIIRRYLPEIAPHIPPQQMN
eukprot:scaffold174595_cov20-Prasinocladus_malaysianus.AAC.1